MREQKMPARFPASKQPLVEITVFLAPVSASVSTLAAQTAFVIRFFAASFNIGNA
jgi:hypothetical protein